MLRWLLVLTSVLFLVPAGRPAATPARESASTNDAASTNDLAAVEAELRRVMEDDEAALEEIDRLIQAEQAQGAQGGAVSELALRTRIQERAKPVRDAYESFLRRHPNHARGHLAFGSFLMEFGEETAATAQMERARELDPANPAAWNNLANQYGHRGPVSKAFEYYAKAIELKPTEPVYYQNLATVVYVFRKDAREFYAFTERQVFDKALDLYRQAIRLDPTNFLLHSDYAHSYYGMLPITTNQAPNLAAARREIANAAIVAWTDALRTATEDLQQEGVRIHLARNHLIAGRPAEARRELDAVSHQAYRSLKERVLRNIARYEAGQTNVSALPDWPEADPAALDAASRTKPPAEDLRPGEDP